MDTAGSGEVQTATATLDISGREDIHKLRNRAIGLGGVLFISFAAMSPLTGQLGNVPIAVGIGNGIGAPAGFWIGIVMLALFSVGYVKMMRSVPSSGSIHDNPKSCQPFLETPICRGSMLSSAPSRDGAATRVATRAVPSGCHSDR